MELVALQYDIAWEDKDANHAYVAERLHTAALEPGSFVVLPELGDTGFSFAIDRIADDRTLPWAQSLARDLGVWLQVGFAERTPEGRGLNCAAVVGPDGSVAGMYRKVHPFSYGREAEHYDGGDALLVLDAGPARVCPLICYDLRFPELWRHAVAGPEAATLFTIGASWPDARQTHWRTLLIARAIENQACVVGVNRVGRDPHLGYAGGSIIVGPHGDVLAEAGDEPALLRVPFDATGVAAWRSRFPALADLRPSLLGRIDRA